jgi:uncharacterized protein
MTELEVSHKDAALLLLNLQHLAGAKSSLSKLDEVEQLVRDLAYVQVDSIQYVERAHHMILQARGAGYKQTSLHTAIEKRQSLFENWTHDATVLPMEFYPYWKLRFEREKLRVESSSWWADRGENFEAEQEKVLNRIVKEGPLRARDFLDERPDKKGGLWEWDPTKTALEFLWRTGRLVIAGRDGFQKIYDLAENVVPPSLLNHHPSEEEVVDWACRGAMDRLGLATPMELAKFWGFIKRDEAVAWCEERKGKDLISVRINKGKDERPKDVLAWNNLENQLDNLAKPTSAVRVISPFDPVIRERKRLEFLFDFDYRFEAFVPAPKRIYGYYVFPLLEGEKFIGRADLKADRKNSALQVNGVWLEDKVKLTAKRLASIERAFDRQRKFCGFESLDFVDGWRKFSAT